MIVTYGLSSVWRRHLATLEDIGGFDRCSKAELQLQSIDARDVILTIVKRSSVGLFQPLVLRLSPMVSAVLWL